MNPGSVFLRYCKRWWYQDRIRVDRRDSRLLWLEPGSVIVLGPNRLRIRERTTTDHCIQYHCEGTQEGHLDIHVTPTDSLSRPRLELFWRAAGTTTKVDPDELEIYAHQ